jgi:AcrR family transcriptional regulator
MTGAMSAEPPIGLRDRKKAEVRGALVEAALALFVERGFDSVTVDEITGLADVSRRTFFRYFPTKDAVVFARREDQLERFRALLARSSKAEPFAIIREALLTLADDYMQKKRRILVESRLVRANAALGARDLEMDRAFELALVDVLAARTRRARVDQRRARILAAALMGAVRVTIDEWVEGGATTDLRALGEQALDLLEPLAPRSS